MAILTQIDQYLKDEATRARVRVALLRWAVARLQNNTRVASEDALAQQILRSTSDSYVYRTLIQTMLALPSFDQAALPDTPAGDAAMQAQVDTLVPALLTRNVLVVGAPDVNT